MESVHFFNEACTSSKNCCCCVSAASLPAVGVGTVDIVSDVSGQQETKSIMKHGIELKYETSTRNTARNTDLNTVFRIESGLATLPCSSLFVCFGWGHLHACAWL